MSKMSQLNLSIQEIAKDDEKLQGAITKQMQEYINGSRPLHNLSYEARCALESFETGNEDLLEERELEVFRMPSWNELNALARIMLPIMLIFILATSALASSHHKGGYHYGIKRTHSRIKVLYQGQYS